METIERCAEGTLIVHSDREETVPLGLKQVLNSLLLKELTTYQGRLDALKVKTGWSRNVPLFIDEQCCLFVTTSHRDSAAVYINCVEIVSIRKYDEATSEIRFKSLNTRRIFVPYAQLKRQYEKACRLLEMLLE